MSNYSVLNFNLVKLMHQTMK